MLLRAWHRRILVAWARAAAPREACGLLLGRVDAAPLEVVEVRRAHNRAASRRRFELDPGDWVATHDDAAARGLAIVGVWHSHPRGPAAPSSADLAEAWPGIAHLIVALDRGRAALLSYRGGDGAAAPLRFLHEPQGPPP